MRDRALLRGWGRTAPSAAQVAVPRNVAEVCEVIAHAKGRGVIARGLGRSYGDAAQCAGGTVLDLRGLDTVGDVDPVTGEVEVGAGVSLDTLVRETLPKGWFLPVTPGTRQVTVGGAIAADVHGKNQHVDGSFSRHLRALSLVTPTGVHELTPERDGPLFFATAGAMGLTGVIARARIAMLPVETDRVVVDTDRYDDVDGAMAAMEDADEERPYSVAWVDCVGWPRSRRGRGALGRSVLTRARHARRADLPRRTRAEPLRGPERARVRVPVGMPSRVLNPVTVGAFNTAWFHRAPRHRSGELQSLWQYFHPLDGVADWNLLYGKRGFVQYQFTVPLDRGDVVKEAIEALATHKVPSFLAVLKRFGSAAPGPLSFPAPGWTLALDLPVAPGELARCLDRLDGAVAEATGRVYLAKDARLRPDLVRAMYPRIGELGELRARVDPTGVLCSDLSRRLGIG